MNNQLRTRLRTLNTEYSALVRNPAAVHRDILLANLRLQRTHIMGMLASDGKLRLIDVPTSDGFGGSIDIAHLLPVANNGMSA